MLRTHLQLARLDYEASDFQQAKAMYQRIRSDYPDADVLNLVHMELGLTHKRLSEIPQAITSLSAISDDWDQWAKIQVELAQLQYFQSRLTRMWTHLSRMEGGAVGTRGPGETQLETDRYAH